MISSQVAAEPDMAPLLTELVDNSDGQEIYLRRPERYGLANDISTTFAEVSIRPYRDCTHNCIAVPFSRGERCCIVTHDKCHVEPSACLHGASKPLASASSYNICDAGC